MSYIDPNYKSKKDFKGAVLRSHVIQHALDAAETDELRLAIVQSFGRPRTFVTYNPSGMFQTPQNGPDVIEGPHYPQPHRWYASVIVRGGCVVSVKS